MSNSLEKIVGQLIIAGFRGKNITSSSPISKYIRDYNLGGVILYDEDVGFKGLGTRNIDSKLQLKDLISNLNKYSKLGLLVSIDQEGGLTNRLNEKYGFPTTPSLKEIGLKNDLAFTNDISKKLCAILNECGINVNFSPVLDLDYGSEYYIGNSERAISNNPQIVIKHALEIIRVFSSHNIVGCGKHFPGQGSGIRDTHEGFTDISTEWSDQDLSPFKEIVKNDMLDMIMVSHVFHKKLDPKLPASLSKKIIQGLLREELKFNGVIICDDPSMKAISDNYSFRESIKLMFNAGVDLFCYGNNLNFEANLIPKAVETICDLISSGDIKISRIESSIDRINAVKKKYKIGS